jgi:large subunit ribosomal protein L18
MARTAKKLMQRVRRKAHVRKHVAGTAERPRLTIFRSNKHVYAQVIDDDRGVTLVSASTRSVALRAELDDADKKAAAKKVGLAVGKAALEAGCKKVVFDRNGFKYHGRVAALADGAREAGLEF